jgi:hypothetical protein
MEPEDEDSAEAMRRFERVVMGARCNAKSLERVVERVGRLNGDKVPFTWKPTMRRWKRMR